MQRVNSIDPHHATGQTKELLDQVQQAFGMVPNTARVMANSAAVLESFLVFNNAMSNVSIGSKLQTQVKLITSESNACEYCTSILTAVAPTAGLSLADVLDSRSGDTSDKRLKSALTFANQVLDSGGKVSAQQLADVRSAGFGDREIVEIVASVVLGCFTNFLNNVADTEIDVPRAPALAKASV